MIQEDIKKHRELFDQLISSEEVQRIELRDQVLSLMNQYCAEISTDLWHHFSIHMLPMLLRSEWTPEMQQDFLVYHRMLNTQGLFTAGNAVFLNLSELVKRADQNT